MKRSHKIIEQHADGQVMSMKTEPLRAKFSFWLPVVVVSAIALQSTSSWAQEEASWDDAMAAATKAFQQGNYDEVERMLTVALEQAKALGEGDPRLATTLENLAMLKQAQGGADEAEPLHRRALEIREEALGPEHGSVARTLYRLAELHYARGNLADAESLYIRSLEISEKAFGPRHFAVATVVTGLAQL